MACLQSKKGMRGYPQLFQGGIIMKKKIFAVLSAAVLGCTALAAPAFAAEEAAPAKTYQQGDVDMDGEITVKDAQLVLQAYTDLLAGKPCELTKQQVALSHISGLEQEDTVYMHDAMAILLYYVTKLDGHSDEEMATFFADYSSLWDPEDIYGIKVWKYIA